MKIKNALKALALAAILLGPAIPVATDHASAINCNTNKVRLQVTTTVPYGGSAGINDLYNVKVINNQATACTFATLTISPRNGMGFGNIQLETGGWDCVAPAVGSSDPTICYNSSVAAYSSTQVKVQYNKTGTVSGAASATFFAAP